MNSKETNVTTVNEEDKAFIHALASLPREKKILFRGILIGIGLQEKPENVYGYNQQVDTKQISLMEYAGEKIM